MSEASKRTLAWREQKRQDGYQPVTIWIPAKMKNAMVNLAFERHQELSALIMEAFQAWPPAKGNKTAVPLDVHRLEALIDRKIAQAMASQSPTPAPPPAAPVPPPPAGMKQCQKGHAPYPASKPECPTCARERKQAYRQRKADKRRGNIPAACPLLGVQDATARPWSMSSKSRSPPAGRYVQHAGFYDGGTGFTETLRYKPLLHAGMSAFRQ
jgi:hypothetical protein